MGKDKKRKGAEQAGAVQEGVPVLAAPGGGSAELVGLLGGEVDRLSAAQDGRRRSADLLSGALAIGSTIVVGATVIAAWERVGALPALPIVLAALALVFAAVALIPSKRSDHQPRLLIARYLDGQASGPAVQRALLEAKTQSYDHDEDAIRRQTVVTLVGFVLLVLAVILLAALVAVEFTG